MECYTQPHIPINGWIIVNEETKSEYYFKEWFAHLLFLAISDLIPLNSSTKILKLIAKELIGMVNAQLHSVMIHLMQIITVASTLANSSYLVT